jgi:peptidoglycan hydrolase CwlO-like protein
MDIEKTMEFILNVQARLEASAQGHEDRLAKLEALAQGNEERIAKLDSSVATVTNLVGRVAQAETRLAERMESMAKRMEDASERTDIGFRELREIQADTQYKLNALIETVDKLVRRNGHKE